MEVCTFHIAQEVAGFWRGEHFSLATRYPSVSITDVTGEPVRRSDVAGPASVCSSAAESRRGSTASPQIEGEEHAKSLRVDTHRGSLEAPGGPLEDVQVASGGYIPWGRVGACL